jgi:signal transduction histidine kinase
VCWYWSVTTPLADPRPRGRRALRWPPPGAALATFAFGAALIAVGLTGLWSGSFVGAGDPASRWWFLLPLAVACGAMAVKTRFPRLALAVATVALVADLYLGSSLGTLLAFYDVLYSAALAASPRLRRGLVAGAAVAIAAPAATLLVVGADLRSALFVGLQLFALLATPLWWASDVRKRNDMLELAAQRAADHARIARLSSERAVAEERTAMARDLHDVVASHMSAVAIRSGAALASPADTAADRAALAAIRESALAAHADLRSMITLLRDGESTPAGSATLADLPGLLDRAGAMGVTARLDDERADDALPADPATEHAAFRIAQEAVMNAVQHAPGCAVVVRLTTHDDGGLGLSVRSTSGRGVAAAAASASHPGFGLLTMAERARALGGEVSVDPSGGEWLVEARLPPRRPAAGRR